MKFRSLFLRAAEDLLEVNGLPADGPYARGTIEFLVAVDAIIDQIVEDCETRKPARSTRDKIAV